MTIVSEKHHVAMVTIKKIYYKPCVFETLKGISNTLQNLRFVQSSVDEIVGAHGIKCGSEISWDKKG